MRKTNLLASLLGLLLALLLVGCGDDDGNGPSTPDSTVDSVVIPPDAYVDTATEDLFVDATPAEDTTVDGPAEDATVDTGPSEDTTVDGPAGDSTVDAGPMGDTTVDSGPPADMGPIPDAPSTANNSCYYPQPLTLSGGEVTVSDDTTGLANEFGTLIDCGSWSFDAPQLYYSIQFNQGTQYILTLVPGSDWDPALYLFVDQTCDPANIDAECGGAGGDMADSGGSGKSESLIFNPPATGTYIIAVDGWSTSEEGPFTLTIQEMAPPSNDTCSAAEALSFAGGVINESSYTVGATDTVNMSATDCTGNTTAGPDVFYKVDLTAGNIYRFKLDGSDFDETLYLFDSCSDIVGSCGSGMGADASTSSAEEITFTPPTSGTYYVAVDGTGATDEGIFTLTVEEFSPPGNDSCASAAQLSFISGVASRPGHTIGAADDVNLTATDCTGQTTAGSDVFYKVDLTAGSTYLFTLDGTDFNESLYIFDSCGDVAGTCGTGMGMDEWLSLSEELSFKPATSGTYYVGIDGREVDDAGAFTITIEEYNPPANDTCGSAEALTLSGGTVTVSAHTLGGTDTVNLTAADCTGNTTAGSDVFYTLDVTAGNAYRIELDGTGFNEVLYLFESCADVAGTCGTGMGADQNLSLSEEVVYTPPTDGTILIGVDALAANEEGAFELTVTEFAAPSNDDCTSAEPLTLSGGTVTVTGSTMASSDTINLPTTGCTGDDTEGGDVFYTVSLTAGQDYKITVDPESGYDPAVYVVTDCANPNTSCIVGRDNASSGSAEIVTFKPTTSGPHTIVVDSKFARTDAMGQGTFDLTIDEVVIPGNNSCSHASAMSFVGGVATVTGDTSNATNDVQISSSSCTGWEAKGPDVFYRIALTGGQTYTVTLTPDSSFDSMVYAFTDCADPEGTCEAGDDALGSGTPDVITLSPATDTSYYIGVDSFFSPTSSSASGSFTLEVQ